MHGVVQQSLLRLLPFRHVGQRSGAAYDLAVRAHNRPRPQREPAIVAVGAAQAQILGYLAALVLQHHVERRAERVAILAVQDRQPGARRAVEAAGRQAEEIADVRSRHHAVASHVPVPDDVAGAGDGQRLPLEVAEQALVDAAARQRVLHHREADQEHDEDEAAAERRLDDVVVEQAGDGHPRPAEPDQHHQPARDQHDRPVVAAEAEEGDEA